MNNSYIVREAIRYYWPNFILDKLKYEGQIDGLNVYDIAGITKGEQSLYLPGASMVIYQNGDKLIKYRALVDPSNERHWKKELIDRIDYGKGSELSKLNKKTWAEVVAKLKDPEINKKAIASGIENYRAIKSALKSFDSGNRDSKLYEQMQELIDKYE